jgi:hypothetical protein
MLGAFGKLQRSGIRGENSCIIGIIEDLGHLVPQAHIMKWKFYALKERIKNLMDLVSDSRIKGSFVTKQLLRSMGA